MAASPKARTSWTGGERGRLVAVNVGLPRDVAWQGRTVHTGVWKSPVDGPRMVRRLNIDGDGQGDVAGHGGVDDAAFLALGESYPPWGEVLGRVGPTPGGVGGGLATAGVADG